MFPWPKARSCLGVRRTRSSSSIGYILSSQTQALEAFCSHFPGAFFVSSVIWAQAALTSSALMFALPPRHVSPGAPRAVQLPVVLGAVAVEGDPPRVRREFASGSGN